MLTVTAKFRTGETPFAPLLPLWTIDVGGLSVKYFRRFHHRLRQRWVRMDGHANIGRERAHFDGQHAFGDQFARPRAHDADTEHAFRLRIDEQLGYAIGPVERNGAPRSRPGELGDGDLASLFLGLRFRQSSPRDFRIGEDDRGDRVRFESNLVAGDGLNGRAALMHCLVRQHRLDDDVTDGIDRGIRGLPVLVDLDEYHLVDFRFRRIEAGNLGVRPASHRHQHAVEDLLFFFYIWTFEGDADTGLLVLERLDRGVQQDRGEKFFQALVQREHQVAVGAGQQAGHHFDTGHLGAERGIDRSHFQSDVAAANDEQRFWNVGQVESAARIHEARAVELEARDDGRPRSGGNDDSGEGQVVLPAAGLRHFHRGGIHERRFTLHELNRALLG